MKRCWKIGIAAFIASLCTARIWIVNHLNIYDKYKAHKIVYEEGTEVALPNAMYYIDTADLLGYHMRVIETKIMNVSDFLAQYDISSEELAALFANDSANYNEFDLIYLVDTEFYNENWNQKSEYPVCLDNFLLVGTDYLFSPATQSINAIPQFNAALENNPAFFIKSNRVLEVTIPYLIRTKGEDGVSLKYLLHSPPKLLVALYPDEIYMELPDPLILY